MIPNYRWSCLYTPTTTVVRCCWRDDASCFSRYIVRTPKSNSSPEHGISTQVICCSYRYRYSCYCTTDTAYGATLRIEHPPEVSYNFRTDTAVDAREHKLPLGGEPPRLGYRLTIHPTPVVSPVPHAWQAEINQYSRRHDLRCATIPQFLYIYARLCLYCCSYISNANATSRRMLATLGHLHPNRASACSTMRSMIACSRWRRMRRSAYSRATWFDRAVHWSR